MTERPLMTADELKSMKKGSFIVMKTGTHPFISKLKLFTKWGIDFDRKPYTVADKGSRKVEYTSKEIIETAICGGIPEPLDLPEETPKPKKKPKTESASGGAVMSEQNEPPRPHNKLRTP